MSKTVDECQSNDNRKGKNYVVFNTSESDAGSMVPSVGSMWSEGPSATEIPKSSTQTISSTGCLTDTSFVTKGCKEKKAGKEKARK